MSGILGASEGFCYNVNGERPKHVRVGQQLLAHGVYEHDESLNLCSRPRFCGDRRNELSYIVRVCVVQHHYINVVPDVERCSQST